MEIIHLQGFSSFNLWSCTLVIFGKSPGNTICRSRAAMAGRPWETIWRIRAPHPDKNHVRVICFHNLHRPDDRRGRSTHSARRQDICLAHESGLRQWRCWTSNTKQDAAFAPREPGCVRRRVSLSDRKKSRGATSLCAAGTRQHLFRRSSRPPLSGSPPGRPVLLARIWTS